MKKLLYLCLLLFPFILSAQTTVSKERSNMYGYWGGSMFASEKLNECLGFSLGMGFSPTPKAGIGAGVDFLFRNELKFAQAYGDFRFFLAGSDKEFTPYIAFQPGAVLYSNTIKLFSTQYKTTGSFAVNALAGVAYRPQKKLGFFFHVGYSNIGFTTNNKTTTYNGAKLGIGIAF